MRRNFLKNFWAVADSMFEHPIHLRRAYRPYYHHHYYHPEAEEYQTRNTIKNSAEDIYKDFIREKGFNSKEEEAFFKKHYEKPEKIEKEQSSQEILNVKKGASMEEIQDSFRKLAIKCHPKNQYQTQQAKSQNAKDFQKIVKAYQNLKVAKEDPFAGFQNRHKKLFEQFKNWEQQDFNKKEVKNQPKDNTKSEKDTSVLKNKKQHFNFQSESSYESYQNGRHTKVVYGTYQQDGKTVKVMREAKTLDDGRVEVAEVIDDGKQVKREKYFLNDAAKMVL